MKKQLNNKLLTLQKRTISNLKKETIKGGFIKSLYRICAGGVTRH